MSSSPAEKTVIRPPLPTPRSVRVINSPLRDDTIRAATGILVLVLAATMAGFVAQSGPMGGLCFVALGIAGWRLWAPITYDLTSRGVIYSILRRTRRIPWAQIARFEERERGLLLFTDEEATVRGRIFIRWNGQRGAILDVVGFYMRQRVSVGSTRTVIYPNGSR